MDRKRVGGPRGRTEFIAVSILNRRIHSVESIGFISHAMVFRRVHVVWHLTVRIKLPRRLPMQGLGLVTMGAGRARSWLIVIQVVMMMVMIVHGGVGRLRRVSSYMLYTRQGPSPIDPTSTVIVYRARRAVSNYISYKGQQQS